MTAEQESLVAGALPLMEKVIAKYVRRLPTHADRDAVRGAGLEGLCRAAKRFDPAMGQSAFSSYAYRRVVGSMLDECRTLDPNPRFTERRTTEISLEVPAGEGITLGDTIGIAERGKELARLELVA